MELILHYRWEHALLAATIEAAEKKNARCRLGRTALQKFLYFMKVLGVPMNYSFDIHHFGPFCQNVMNDVEWLQAEAVVVDDATTDQSGSAYSAGPGWQELQVRFGDELAPHRRTIDVVCDAFAGMTTKDLEIASTLDFCFRWVRAGGGAGPWRDRSIARFREAKKNKFSDEEINHWYGVLESAKLVEP